MHIAVLGTGMVGRRLATGLVAEGNHVILGSRSAHNEAALEWAGSVGDRAQVGTFADAASVGELVFNCVSGAHTLGALGLARSENLAGKILVDVSNPLDFSKGFPPFLSVGNTDSLAEQIQAAHPEARVVKALNTVANELMVDPRSLAGGDHTLMICGDDPEAKREVSALLAQWFGWTDIVDVGGIDAARGLEAWLLLWTRLYGALGTGHFNLKLVR